MPQLGEWGAMSQIYVRDIHQAEHTPEQQKRELNFISLQYKGIICFSNVKTKVICVSV